MGVPRTTPAFLAIADEASRANNVSFTDDAAGIGFRGGLAIFSTGKMGRFHHESND